MISVTSADDSNTSQHDRDALLAERVAHPVRVRARAAGAGGRRRSSRSTKTTDSATIASNVSMAPPAVVIATTKARMLHAVTSSTAAQVMAVVPSGVCVRLRSSRMRASTGNAVMLIAMPQNSANAWNGTPGGAYCA